MVMWRRGRRLCSMFIETFQVWEDADNVEQATRVSILPTIYA